MIAADGALLDLCLFGRLPLLPRVDVLTCMLAALVRFFLLAIFRFPYQLRYDGISSSFAATARPWEQILVASLWAHSHSTLPAFSKTRVIWSFSRLAGDGKRRRPIHGDRPSPYTI